MKNILYTLTLIVSFSSFGQFIKNNNLNSWEYHPSISDCDPKLRLLEGVEKDGVITGKELFFEAGSWKVVLEDRGYKFPINNQSIIDMLNEDFDDKVIIAKIRSSKSFFNVSLASLKKLRDLGVSSNILAAMIKKPYTKGCDWVNYDPLSAEMDKLIYSDLYDNLILYRSYYKKWVEVASEVIPEAFAYYFPCREEEW